MVSFIDCIVDAFVGSGSLHRTRTERVWALPSLNSARSNWARRADEDAGGRDADDGRERLDLLDHLGELCVHEHAGDDRG